MTLSNLWISLFSLVALASNPLVRAADSGECTGKFTADDTDCTSVDYLDGFGRVTAKTICMPDSNRCMEFTTLELGERRVAPPEFECTGRLCTRMCEGRIASKECRERPGLSAYGKVSKKTVCMPDSDLCTEFTMLQLSAGSRAPAGFECVNQVCTRTVDLKVAPGKQTTHSRYGFEDVVEVAWKCAAISIAISTISYVVKAFLIPQ